MKRLYDPDKPRFNPRSPVQPGRSSAPYFIAVLIAGIVIWSLQQWAMEDSDLPSLRPTTETNHRLGAASAKGDLRTIFSADDYPAAAWTRGEQGSVQAKLDVDERGQVSRCTIVRSSGHESLDEATCRILEARARFTPARDASGAAIEDSVVTPPIVWRLEG
ncbi:MAG TPA: energy transducer TonB [Sphingomicrobium sp.]|nr:energy transducer TonB [Sphingomicrobium sp.]